MGCMKGDGTTEIELPSCGDGLDEGAEIGLPSCGDGLDEGGPYSRDRAAFMW